MCRLSLGFLLSSSSSSSPSFSSRGSLLAQFMAFPYCVSSSRMGWGGEGGGGEGEGMG